MTNTPGRRRVAMLWFTASATSLAAAIISYAEEGEIKWLLLAAGMLMAMVGFRALRRSASSGL